MDPYVYPETSILANLWDIKDAEQLSVAEAIATTRRIADLERSPMNGRFDIGHLRAIHRHIFQDVYAWAGELRTVNIARPGQFDFAFVERIATSLNDLFSDAVFSKLSTEPGQNRATFTSSAARYLGELNAIHPFRDGNGRAQREFIRQLALHNGYVLDWSRISRGQMHKASHRSFERGDNTLFEQVLQSALR